MNTTKKRALNDLRSIADETEKFLDSVNKSSSKISTQKVSTLFGSAGILIGFATAYPVSTLLGIPLFLSIPILALLGGILGVIFYKGPQMLILEHRIETNEKSAEAILKRIKALPKNAPKEVVDELWMVYRSLTGLIHAQTSATLFTKNIRKNAVVASSTYLIYGNGSQGFDLSYFRKYQCQRCGHVYDEALGWPLSKIPPGTRWENISSDLRCEKCRHPDNCFELLYK